MARRRRGQFPEPRKENNLWKIRYRTDQAQHDGTIRRVQRTKCLGPIGTMTLTQARKAAVEFLQPINDVEPGLEHADKTVNQLIARWRVSVMPTLKPSTQRSYEWAFQRIGPAFGRVPLAVIGKADVQRFLTVASRHLSPKSVRNLRCWLRALLTIAVEWDWIATNPAAGKVRLPEKLPVRDRRLLIPEQYFRLVPELVLPYSTVVTVAVLGGLRKGEIEALRWEDVLQGKLMVDETTYRGELGSPKSRRSRREVAIGEAVQAALEEWQSIAPFTAPRDFVFGIRTNSPIDLHNAVARHVKPVCRELGLPEVSWHDLRHTYTTWVRQAGVPPEVLQAQLGHADISTTLGIYSHAGDDREHTAAQIEQFVAESVTPKRYPARTHADRKPFRMKERARSSVG